MSTQHQQPHPLLPLHHLYKDFISKNTKEIRKVRNDMEIYYITFHLLFCVVGFFPNWRNIQVSFPLCSTAAGVGPTTPSVNLSVFFINCPNSFRVKIIPLSSNRTGQPFRTFSLHSWAFSKFLVVSCSSLSSFSTLVFRVWFSFCSIEDRWVKMASIFLVASQANISTVFVCRRRGRGHK